MEPSHWWQRWSTPIVHSKSNPFQTDVQHDVSFDEQTMQSSLVQSNNPFWEDIVDSFGVEQKAEKIKIKTVKLPDDF